MSTNVPEKQVTCITGRGQLQQNALYEMAALSGAVYKTFQPIGKLGAWKTYQKAELILNFNHIGKMPSTLCEITAPSFSTEMLTRQHPSPLQPMLAPARPAEALGTDPTGPGRPHAAGQASVILSF